MNKNLKKYIAYNRTTLENSQKSLKDIFEIMFHEKDNILCEGNDGFRTYKYTYGEMKDRIEVGASALFEKIGATHEFVALEMDNSPNWITAFWFSLVISCAWQTGHLASFPLLWSRSTIFQQDSHLREIILSVRIAMTCPQAQRILFLAKNPLSASAKRWQAGHSIVNLLMGYSSIRFRMSAMISL